MNFKLFPVMFVISVDDFNTFYVMCVQLFVVCKLFVCNFVVGEMQSVATFCKYPRLCISRNL